MTGQQLRLGVAVSTLGRRPIHPLLDSLARGERQPNVVAVANQGSVPLDLPIDAWPFEILHCSSSGGLSAGRNDALSLIVDRADLIGFPNDDSVYGVHTLDRAARAYLAWNKPAAVAGSLYENATARYVLPAAGEELSRRSIWRAIEAATFIGSSTFASIGNFDVTLGTGATSPWQSGEGTDLLLRAIQQGMRVVSAPEVEVLGSGEQRNLSQREYAEKVRAYSRGTGIVFRRHRYSFAAKTRLVLAPTARLAVGDWSAHNRNLALARTLGRMEGLLERKLTR